MRLLVPLASGFKPVRPLGAPSSAPRSTSLQLAWPLANLHKLTQPRAQPAPAFYQTIVILCAIWKLKKSNSIAHVTRTFISSRYPGMLLLSVSILVLDLIFFYLCEVGGRVSAMAHMWRSDELVCSFLLNLGSKN